MKNRKKPIQAALFFCVIPLLLTTGSCTTQDKNTANIHSWTKDVDSLATGKAGSMFWPKVRSRSNMVDAYKRLGGFYQKQGKHRKAIAEFIKAIKTKTADAAAYNSLAMSYDALKKYKFAEMAYKDAIALAPEQSYLYNNYGCSSMQRGDMDAAVALLEKAAALDADSRRIKNNLALAIQRANKNVVLKTDIQDAAQLPGLYVNDRPVVEATEPEVENANSKEVASSLPVATPVTAELEPAHSPSEEIFEEPAENEVATETVAEILPDGEGIADTEISEESVVETTVVEKVEIEEQIVETAPLPVEPEVEEIASVEVLEQPVFENTVTDKVEVKGLIVETQPILTEPVVEETAAVEVVETEPVTVESAVIVTEGVEAVQVESDPIVELVERSADESVVTESTFEQVEAGDSEAATSMNATSSDDEDNWYNNFIASTLDMLGFENDDAKSINVESFVAVDKPAVAIEDVTSIEQDAPLVEQTVQVQEKVAEETIEDAKPDRVIHVKGLQIVDSINDKILSPKSYAPIADVKISSSYTAVPEKRNFAAATDLRQRVQTDHKAAIEVSNGNGVEGMAPRSAVYFKEQGENIRRITNAKHFGFKNSIVFYREGYLPEAYKIALMVPGYQEMKQVDSLGRPEITVKLLLGKDMASLHFPESMAGISSHQISSYGQTVTMLER